MKRSLTTCCAVALLVTILCPLPARAEVLSPEVRAAVNKGLGYLAKQQFRDGHWEANGGQYPMAMTALAGMALLMEGSTMREGKYSPNIRRAVDWFLSRSQPNGLLGNPALSNEGGRYMYGHGFGTMFLSQVYGEEGDADRRRRLEDVLTRAVDFIGKAQSTTGGWNYVSNRDGGRNGHEGSVTITQMQALRAARNAGIRVPKEIIDRGMDYLKRSTGADGGVQYSLGGGGATGPLTAAGLACGFAAGEYNSDLAKRWLRYCHKHISISKTGNSRFGHYEYTHYYYAQCLYILGDDGFSKLFPAEKNPHTWSLYKENIFEHLVKSQNPDGSWSRGYIGAVYNTSCFLTLLQLDRATLPIYQR